MSQEGYKNESIKSPEELEAQRLVDCIYGLGYFAFVKKLSVSEQVDLEADKVAELEIKKRNGEISATDLLQSLSEILLKVKSLATEVGVDAAEVSDDALLGYKQISDYEAHATEERARLDREAGVSPDLSLMNEIFRKDIKN
jgi:hypothetical protein